VRSHLDDRSPAAEAAFECLSALVADPTRPERARLAALAALEGLPAPLRASIQAGLREDPSPAVRARAGRGLREPAGTLDPQRLPDDPEAAREAIGRAATAARFGVLHAVVQALCAREEAEPSSERRTAWRIARAAAHQALATRGSRVAIYDLRETLAASDEPLPVGFLAALSAVGDSSCLEPLAGAYVRSRAARDDWWRRHLAAAFRDILRRERITRRHPALRKILARWPSAAAELLAESKPRRPRKTRR
jgi:hypothetical protein